VLDMAITVEEAVALTVITAPVYAYGVIRVSEEGGRSGRKTDRAINRVPHVRNTGRRQSKLDTFRSPGEQQERINGAVRYLEVEGRRVEIAETFKEIDVSGRRPLKRRKGLLAAVEGIEAGHAKVLIVAYFDRLMRDLDVKREVVRRVEAVGGMVFAVDFGAVSHATAIQRLTSDIVGAHAEYVSRSTGERLGGIQAAAIAEGLPIGAIAPGYRQDPETFRLVDHPTEGPVMTEAFRMRADGASWRRVRQYMADNGIERTVGSVRKLLHSRTYLGVLFHGKHEKVGNHVALTDPITFERVAGRKGTAYGTPGRKSPLLLSTTRVLRCGTCKRAMQAGSQKQGDKTWPVYKCNPNGMCTKRTAIDAAIADKAVGDYIKAKLADETATEGIGMELIAAQGAAAAAATDYAKVQRNLALSANEAETQAILREYRDKRDATAAHAAELERRVRTLDNAAVTLNVARDWDKPESEGGLSLAGKRDLIVSVLDRVEVATAGVVNGRRLPRGAGRLQFFDHTPETLALV
jgi:DNA invertase Pin-like site-specific DNA recombinase